MPNYIYANYIYANGVLKIPEMTVGKFNIFLYVHEIGQFVVTFFGSSWQTYLPLLLQRPFTHLPSCPYVSPPGK